MDAGYGLHTVGVRVQCSECMQDGCVHSAVVLLYDRTGNSHLHRMCVHECAWVQVHGIVCTQSAGAGVRAGPAE